MPWTCRIGANSIGGRNGYQSGYVHRPAIGLAPMIRLSVNMRDA